VGAGSRSTRCDNSSVRSEFQSPRRWGGVGLPAHAEGHGANLGQRVSIPSEVGRGRAGPSGKPCSTPSCLVSIPSEVGRGRASSRPMTFGQCEKIGGVEFQSPRRWGGVGLLRSLQRLARHELGERFSVSSRKRYKTRLAFSGTRVSWKTQETRSEQVAAGRKKRRARPPRSGTGTRQGARRKPETRRGPVHSPRIETGQGRR